MPSPSRFPVFILMALLLQASVVAGWGASPDDLVSRGDALDQKFRAAEALKYYLPAEKSDPKDWRLLLKIARQYRHLMADASSTTEKLRLGNIALTYAQRAETLAPEEAETHLSVAISYGKMLPILGTKDQVAASPKVKSEVDEAIRLDPGSDLAWHILGRWHRILADVGSIKRALAPLLYGSLPKGSNEEAVRCLEKAIELNPKRLIHYVELGRIYAQIGRKEDARKMLEKGLAMPNVEKDDPEAKAHAREALDKLK